MANISSNIIYVEPNYAYSHKKEFTSFNYNGEETKIDGISVCEMAPPLEDYCIAFQLAVEVPTTVNQGTIGSGNTVFVLSYNNSEGGTAVSLLQGTRLPNSNVNYLTTAALETNLQDVKEASSTELFGVKSIDITYNAWMSPEITMKFTDIRGASLFVPEELTHTNVDKSEEKKDKITGSFFKCFFMFPYPLFGLVVKGFYGEAVSYEMMCCKFNYKLDSATGNFEAEAKFIGYTWSILADITLNSIVAAPYDKYAGEEYWKKKQDEDGDGAFKVTT